MVRCVGRHSLATKRRRWPAPLGALVVTTAAFLTAGAGTAHQHTGTAPLSGAELIASQSDMSAAPPSARYKISAPPEEFMISTLVADRSYRRQLPVGVAPERGLQVETILVARAVSVAFPEIRNIGGVRPDSLKWHPSGMAIDVMIPNYQSPEGKLLGDRIAAWALKNATRFQLNHVIWRRVLFQNGGASMMPNMGSDDANHYTHVHIATNGGGYPTGLESYFG